MSHQFKALTASSLAFCFSFLSACGPLQQVSKPFSSTQINKSDHLDSVNTQITSQASDQLTNKLKTKRVKFDLKLPSGFQTKQTANIQYAKLEIHHNAPTGTPIYAVGATDGFVSISGSGAVSISADVPTPSGGAWYATIGLYYTTSSEPVLEFKTAFDLPATGTIPIDIHTHLLGAVVEALWARNSSLVSSLNLTGLQSYLDGLTGASLVGESWGFSRLGTLSPADPRSLSAQRIAQMMDTTGSLTLDQNAGQALTVSDYLPVPGLIGTYSGLIKNNASSTNNQGFIYPLAIDAFDTTQDRILFTDQGSSNINEHVYGVNGSLISSGQSAQLFSPVALTTFRSGISMGLTNPTGIVDTSAAFVVQHNTNAISGVTTATLKALNPASGGTFWSFSLPGNPSMITNAGLSDREPGLTLLRSNTCGCDNTRQDTVIVAYNADEPDPVNNPRSGLYAIRLNATSHEPEQIWYQPTPLNSLSNDRVKIKFHPVLTSDRSKLLAMTEDKKLMIIPLDAASGAIDTNSSVQTVSLPLASGDTPTTPMSLGNNGAVYFAAVQSNGINSRVYALNTSDGSSRWGSSGYFVFSGSGDTLQVATRISTALIIDKNPDTDADVIYLIDKDRKIWAINPDKTLKWTSPYILSSTGELAPYTSLILGAGAQNLRVLYVGLGISGNVANTLPYQTKVFAVKDAGTSGEELWNINPNGNLWSGLALWKGSLYAVTSDGNYYQYNNIQAIRTETNAFPSNAPWPTQRGNYGNSGISHMTMR